MPGTTLTDQVVEAYRAFAQERIGEAPEKARGERKLAGQWRVARLVLLISGVLLAAAAGVTALPADVASWVTPTLAFLAAAVTGLNTGLHPSQGAADHCKAAAAWEVLAADCRVFSAMLPSFSSEEAKKEFESLKERYAALTGTVPENV